MSIELFKIGNIKSLIITLKKYYIDLNNYKPFIGIRKKPIKIASIPMINYWGKTSGYYKFRLRKNFLKLWYCRTFNRPYKIYIK